LLIPHLGGGGAERVMELLARRLPAEKYELHLGLITQAETGAEGLPSGVQLHALGAPRVRSGAFRLLRLIRRLKPDLILPGIFHLNFLVLLLRPLLPRRTRILARQNGTVSSALSFGGLPGYTRLLYRLLYRRADRVICQTRAMAADLAEQLGLPEDRLVVLPNPVDVEQIRRLIRLNPVPQTGFRLGPGPHLLAVGRLSREKGFDLLLRALAEVRRQFAEASLLMVGAGPEEAALKAECHALGLDRAVRFAGQVAEPWQYFQAATLFVLPSRHEGLPNALLEAAAAGVPIVALPASGGVAELLSGQLGVWLAPEVSAEALTASLLAALYALRPGERFAHPFVEPFCIDRSIRAYENLIDASLHEQWGRAIPISEGVDK
jgi:glycosyltransferase involved in cell wall biosynthesis